jgi:acetyl-CoA carboxylase alpha subunit
MEFGVGIPLERQFSAGKSGHRSALSGKLTGYFMEPTLADKINDLRNAIEQIEGLPEEQRQNLKQSLEELEQSAASQDNSHLPPLQQLEDSMLELEAKHPDATQLLKSVADALGRIGL